MDNFKSMLSKSQPKATANTNTTDEPISAKLASEKIEWLRDYQYAMALSSGNFKFSFKDALENSIVALQQSCTLDVKPRPETIRENEKKIGRKKKQ